MYRMGQEEVVAVAKVLLSGKPFRYFKAGECERFEQRYAKYLGSQQVLMTASGCNALTAALGALGIGPGDEVIVPAHTYMATAVAVLAVGAIPLIVDIDDTITLCPKATEAAIGPRTKAIIPVHMWGLPCDMKSLMAIAKKHKLLVIEDACQAVGGSYEGQKCGSIGDVGCFSFNYYKNMTAGEGGALATNNPEVLTRARCMVDCCSFYWNRENLSTEHFVANGARATEIAGAILNIQLDRLPDMIKRMRGIKHRVLKAVADTKLKPIRANSLAWECGTTISFTLPTEEIAAAFAKDFGCGIAGRTGRHVYTDWDPILEHKGAHHPALNPYLLKENAKCRKTYSRDMCQKSLDILRRTIMISTHPDWDRKKVNEVVRKLRACAKTHLGG
jgi:dTDP-4-amino-4,6-dideoxygalactose transaminase